MFQQKQISIRTEALKHERPLKLISIPCQGKGFALAHNHVLFENTLCGMKESHATQKCPGLTEA